MFPVGLSRIREPVLRRLLVGMGVVFIAVAMGLLGFHDWQADESRLVLLAPALLGAALIAVGALLQGSALRRAVAVLLIALGALPWICWGLSRAMGLHG